LLFLLFVSAGGIIIPSGCENYHHAFLERLCLGNFRQQLLLTLLILFLFCKEYKYSPGNQISSHVSQPSGNLRAYECNGSAGLHTDGKTLKHDYHY